MAKKCSFGRFSKHIIPQDIRAKVEILFKIYKLTKKIYYLDIENIFVYFVPIVVG